MEKELWTYRLLVITEIEISYEKDLGYDKKGSVTLIKKDNKWWVVSFEGSKEV